MPVSARRLCMAGTPRSAITATITASRPTALAISRASSGSMHLGLPSTRFTPIASAPRRTHASAWSGVVTPQILTRTTAAVTKHAADRTSRVDLQELSHLRDHLRRLNRLRDVRVCAELKRALAIFVRTLGRDHDDGD